MTVLKITLCKDWCDVCSCIGDSGSWIGMQRIFLPSQLPSVLYSLWVPCSRLTSEVSCTIYISLVLLADPMGLGVLLAECC